MAEVRKAALVTGAGRGIGRAIALELARAGHHVAINYRSRHEAAEETLSLLREAGGDGELLSFDVTQAEPARQAVEDFGRRLGRLDVLVNNAGITADGLFAMMPEASWHIVLATSLDGFYNVTKPAIKLMIRQRRGSIVNVSSISGLVGNRGQANYAAAKAGLIGATRALASEVARLNIRVNAVAPGLIRTEMTQDVPLDRILPLVPMARVGEPEEVARVVRFLCSEDASYVTGQVISINGGMA
ncbi:MAG: 3-oxoacyl-ACP reductase FabG [Deltaproteobacteria bacterium]|nr:3-oxoacyl-ACP reductase FabG [Deltaproteobacteria bacterium]